jgi:hypothetical protein
MSKSKTLSRSRRPRRQQRYQAAKPSIWPSWPDATYQWLTIFLILLSFVFITIPAHDQRRLFMPDPWAYEMATQQFAQGQWVLTDDQAAQARTEVRLRGGTLEQYVPSGQDQWVFRQSPGYPLLLVPFYRLGLPRLANFLLAAVAATILYRLLSRWYDPQIAAIGILLLLWSPISLVASHYLYMATFASGMLMVISGGLLLWYDRDKQMTAWAWLGLFAAGLAGGWAVLARNVNILPLLVLGGYLLLRLWQRYKETKQITWQPLVAWGLGGLIALTVLLAYNTLTFGQPLDTGYAYPSPDDKWYLWKGNPATEVPGGTQTWLAEGTVGAIFNTLVEHAILWSRPAILGWPFLPLVLLAVILALWRQRTTTITWFLVLWCLAVYSFYAGVVFFGITRILSVPNNLGWGFFTGVRYLFPASLPFILLFLDWLIRWPRRYVLALALVYLLLSSWIFWRVVTP